MSSSPDAGFAATPPFGSPGLPGQPPTNGTSEAAAPTWRDLPYEPPYGPVPPPRTPNIGNRVADESVDVEEDSSISAAQIALAIGGLLLLIALGIGAALLLLDENDDAVAQSDPPPVQQPPVDVPLVEPTPPVGQVPPSTPDQDGQGQQDLSPEDGPAPGQGELEPGDGAPPSEDGSADEQAPDGQEPGADDSGGQEPGADDPAAAPTPEQVPEPEPDAGPGEDPAQDQPGAVPPPETPPQDQPDIDLPRLFELRRLPAGTEEGTTTVRQTSSDGTDPVTEQTTILTTDGSGEYSVVATRSEEAAARYDQLNEAASRELTVSGEDAILTDDGDLAYLVPGTVDTLIVIDGPEGVGTDQLIVVAQGLELLQ